MKVNINKYQIGGGLLTYKAPPMLPSGIAAPAPPAEDNFNMVDILSGKGLTSDTAVYANQLEGLYELYNSLNPAIKESPYGMSIRRQLKGDPVALAALANSKDKYTKAMAYVASEKAASDFATFQGNVIVHNAETKQEEMMSIPEYWQAYKKDPQKYKALTYSQVGELRERSPKYAGNDQMLSFLEGARSTSSALEEVRKFMNNVKSHVRSTASVTAEDRQIEQGLDQMAKGLSYIKTSEGESFKSNTEQLKAAAKSMWANIGDDVKNVFRMKAIQAYPDLKNLDAAAMGLAMSMLDPMHETDYKTKESEVPTKDPASGKKGSGSELEARKYYTLMSQGQGDPATRALSFTSKDKKNYNVEFNSKQFPGLMNPTTGEYIAKATVDDLTAFMGLGDPNSISFEGYQVPQEKLKDFVYQFQNVYRINVLAKVDHGVYQPDLEAEYNLSQAEEKVAQAQKSQKQPLPVAVKKQIYDQYHIPTDPTGEPTLAAERKSFFVLPKVTTTSKVIGEDNVNDNMRLTGKIDKEAIQEVYESLYQTKPNSKGETKTLTKNTGGFAEMLQGNLYMLASGPQSYGGVLADKSGVYAPKNLFEYTKFNRKPGRTILGDTSGDALQLPNK